MSEKFLNVNLLTFATKGHLAATLSSPVGAGLWVMEVSMHLLRGDTGRLCMISTPTTYKPANSTNSISVDGTTAFPIKSRRSAIDA
ncbi:hypothetical protein TcWFU_010286 [Taenia crassiceps]|uniref:Uncharacterized protein n=1 Tax=Taenia crassiceps TaxID=6207 RepID=A0ABR4QNS3_9CEST